MHVEETNFQLPFDISPLVTHVVGDSVEVGVVRVLGVGEVEDAHHVGVACLPEWAFEEGAAFFEALEHIAFAALDGDVAREGLNAAAS